MIYVSLNRHVFHIFCNDIKYFIYFEMPLLKRLAKSRYFCTCSIFNNQYNTMKHLLILLLACTFSFPSRGQSIIQLSPLQGERGIQAAIEKASMNGSSILLHDGDYILHKSIDIKNCKKGIIIKGKNPGKVQLRCDKPLKGKLRPVKDTQTKNRVHPNAQGIIMEIDLSEIGINVPFFPDLMKERKTETSYYLSCSRSGNAAPWDRCETVRRNDRICAGTPHDDIVGNTQ